MIRQVSRPLRVPSDGEKKDKGSWPIHDDDVRDELHPPMRLREDARYDYIGKGVKNIERKHSMLQR